MGFWDFLPWRKNKGEYPSDLPEDIKIAFEECEKEVEKHGRTKDGNRILWETINRLHGPQDFNGREPALEGSPGSTPTVNEHGGQESLQTSNVTEPRSIEPTVVAVESKPIEPTGNDPQGIQRPRGRPRKFNPI